MKKVIVDVVSYDEFVCAVRRTKEWVWAPEEFRESLIADVYTCYSCGELPYKDGGALGAMVLRFKNRCSNWYRGHRVALKYVGEVWKRGTDVMDGSVSLDGIDIEDGAVAEDMIDGGVEGEVLPVDACIEVLLHLSAGGSKSFNSLLKGLREELPEDVLESIDGIMDVVRERRRLNKKH